MTTDTIRSLIYGMEFQRTEIPTTENRLKVIAKRFSCTVVLILVFSNIAFSAPAGGDAGDIRPLKEPVEIKESIIPFLFSILVLVLIGAVILGFIYFRKKSRAAAAPRS